MGYRPALQTNPVKMEDKQIWNIHMSSSCPMMISHLRCSSSEGKDGNYVREKHWHRSVEIFALFEVELRFFLNEKEYPLKPGEFMLVNSNEIHSIQSPKANRTIVLQIPLATFENYYTEERFIYFSHSSRLQDEEVMRLIEDMYETYARRDCGYELKVLGQFYLLVYLLVAKYREMEVSMELVRRNKKV